MRRPVKYTLLGAIPVVLAGIFTGFFLCGSFFLTRVVLPAVSARAGIDIAAERLKWSVFSSRLAAEKLRIGPADAPCFTAGRAEFTFALRELLAGRLKFSDIYVERGDFALFRVADGWSCFRPASSGKLPSRTAKERSAAVEPEATTLSEPRRQAEKKGGVRLDLARIRLENSRLTLVYGSGGAGGAFELSELSGRSPAFRNGAPFSVELSGRVKLATSRASHVDDGRMKLSFVTPLNESLQPGAVSGTCVLSALSGTVGGVDLEGGALSLEVKSRERADGFDIDRLRLEQSRDGVLRSVLELTGSVRRSPFAVDVNVNRGTVSPEVMAICADLGLGFNPGRATLECRGKFSYGGRRLSSDGMLRLTRSGDAIFGLERIRVPDFRLEVEHRAEVDFNRSEIDLSRFSAAMETEGRESASLRLRRPVRYSWRTRGSAGQESARFDLNFDRFDLSLLRFAFPHDSPFRFAGGKFSAKVQLLFRHNLSSVGVLGSGRLEGGRWRFGTRRFPADEVLLGLDFQLRRNLDFRVNNITLSLRDRERGLGTLSFSGRGSLPRREAELELRFERLAPEWAAWWDPSWEPFAAGWRKLGISPADLTVAVALSERGNAVHLRDCRLSADRGKKPFAALQLNSFTWFPGSGTVNHGPGFSLRCAFPAEMVNPLLAGAGVEFRSGRLQWNLTGRLTRQLDGGVVDGECSLDDAGMRWGGRSLTGFGVQNRFSLYLPDFNTLEIKTANFYLRRRGRPALRLECPGTFDFQEGRYRGEWQLRYLNEQFLNLFSPVLVEEAQFSGRLQVSAQNHFESFRAAGAVECSRWLAPEREKLPFNGRLLAVFESTPRQWAVRNFQLKFRRAEHLLADFTGECRVDRFQVNGPVAVRLSSSRVELGELLKLFPPDGVTRPTEGNEAAKRAAVTGDKKEISTAERSTGRRIPFLFFGSRPVDFGCRFEKLRFSPELEAELEGRFRLKQGEAHSEYLNFSLNGARFDAEVRASSQPEGIRGELAVRGDDRLPCRPLLELLTGVREDGFEGVLSSLNTHLTWLDDGGKNKFLNTLTGYFRMKLRDVVIPNGVADSLFGRLLLLPVDLAGKLSTLMPEELAALPGKIFSAASLQRTLRTIRFSSGELDFSADRGEVNVRECRFLGDWIDRIGFTGRFQLGGEQKLQLESQLAVGGIPLTVPVRGTLTRPVVDIQQGATAGISDFIQRVHALKLIDFGTDSSGEPALLIRDLPLKDTLRELRYIFDELFKQKR